MSTPALPPYLGSWDDLVNALLHDPFLGSGRGGRPHLTHTVASEMLRMGAGGSPVAGPRPEPWSPASAFISLVSLRVVAEQMPEGREAQYLGEFANRAIAELIDDYCGTHPRPWPWPGPPPWVFQIVSELAIAANAMQAGDLREGLMATAGTLAQRGLEVGGV